MRSSAARRCHRGIRDLGFSPSSLSPSLPGLAWPFAVVASRIGGAAPSPLQDDASALSQAPSAAVYPGGKPMLPPTMVLGHVFEALRGSRAVAGARSLLGEAQGVGLVNDGSDWPKINGTSSGCCHKLGETWPLRPCGTRRAGAWRRVQGSPAVIAEGAVSPSSACELGHKPVCLCLCARAMVWEGKAGVACGFGSGFLGR
jgi:hypothetical protein